MVDAVWVFRTMIIPAAIAGIVRSMTDNFGPAAMNMFRTPLSATGAPPATHYVSTGQIDSVFASMMVSPEALVSGVEGFGLPLSLQDATTILSMSDVSEEPPFEAFARLGLKLISEE